MNSTIDASISCLLNARHYLLRKRDSGNCLWRLPTVTTLEAELVGQRLPAFSTCCKDKEANDFALSVEQQARGMVGFPNVVREDAPVVGRKVAHAP
jgi:hypothetical protein